MNPTDMTNWIITTLQDRFGIEPGTTAATTFTELDLDSLMVVELAVRIEREFGIVVDESDVDPDLSIHEVAELILALPTKL